MTTPPDDQPLSMVRARAAGRTDPVRAAIPVGTVDAAAVGDVDGAGWVQLRGATWSMDWWVGAEDRWHHPAVEPAVRQRTVDSAPIVETAMRVPGGDVLQRVFGVRATSPATDGELWDDSAVLVEFENATAVPVALAVVLRPLTLWGPGGLGPVEVDRSVVRVDGRVAAVVSRPVVRVAHGLLGTVGAALAEGRDAPAEAGLPPTGVGDEVALVVPLPHTAVVRVLLPRQYVPARRRWFGGGGRPTEPGATFEAPDADTILKGWAAHTRDVARVDLSEPLLDQQVLAAPRALVLSAGDHVMDRAERAVQVTELLARCRMTEPLGPVARALVETQRLGGAVRLDDDGDATAALLFAAAPLLTTGSERWEELLVGPVAKSIHLVRKGGALSAPSTWRAGAAALALVAPALRAIGQPEVAADALEASARVAARGDAHPVGPGDDGDLLSELVALRDRIAAGDSAAVAELLERCRLGEPGAVVDRYDDRGVPSGSLGDDPGAVAARAAAVLDVAMVDGAAGPILLPAWPAEWWGRNLEVHGVSTRFGDASFALRWHGERPAVLWEVEAASGVDPAAPVPVLTCPGLDPAWRGEGWTGEALLGAVAAPEGLLERASGAPAASVSLSPTVVDLPSPPAEGQSFS